MSLSLEEVRKVARLARLALTPEEEERYARQLSAVLDHFAALQAVDTSQVEPTRHAAGVGLLLREDEVRPSLPPEKLMATAPAKSGSSLVVPRIIE